MSQGSQSVYGFEFLSKIIYKKPETTIVKSLWFFYNYFSFSNLQSAR